MKFDLTHIHNLKKKQKKLYLVTFEIKNAAYLLNIDENSGD